MPGAVPLLLIHAAGSSCLHYRALVKQLGTGQPVMGVEDRSLAAGNGAGRVPFAFASIHDVADAVVELLENTAQYSKGGMASSAGSSTVFVGGWSYGGVVALEVMARLEAQGRVVPAAFLIDAPVRTLSTLEREEGSSGVTDGHNKTGGVQGDGKEKDADAPGAGGDV